MAHEIKVIALNGRTPEADEKVLQALAAEDWELVQIDPLPASRWYYLRRAKVLDAKVVEPPTPAPPPDIEPTSPEPARSTWKWLLGIGE